MERDASGSMEVVAERGWDLERKCTCRGDISDAVQGDGWKLEQMRDRQGAAHMCK